MPENDKNRENEKIMALIDLIPDSVVIADAEGKIVAVNKVVGTYTGIKPETLVGKNFLDLSFFEKQTKAILQRHLKKRMAGFPVPAYEIKIRDADGNVKFFEIRGNKIEYEGKICDFVILHDVTERSNHQKRLRRELRKSDEKFCGITNSIRDAIILVNEEAKVSYWNPAAERTFGYTSEEASGKYVHELIVPKTMCEEGKERIDASVKIFGQTGIGYFTVGNVEVLGRRKDGSIFPAELTISPTKIAEKWHAVGVVKDISRRKKEEQKLRDAEQRYHVLFNQSPLGILIIDPETGAFVEFNDVAPLQLGYSRDEFGKLCIYDVVAGLTNDEMKSKMTEVLNNGGGEFESRHRTKNGEIRNVLISASTLQLTGKTLLHTVFHDITEIRKVQNDLAESEARYRQLVELAQEGIWAIDNDLNTTFVNPRMAQMLGCSQSEMLGRNLVNFLDKGTVEMITGILGKFDKPGIKGQFECQFLREDGTHISTGLAVSTITDDNGKVIGKLALVADISERKHWENELRASEERFRSISTSAMDAIIVVDAADTVIYWNPAAESALGYSEKEAVGRELSKLIVPPQSSSKHNALLQEVIRKSSLEKHFELKAVKKDGITIPIELSVKSMKINDKNCMLAIVRDISERKAMEDALKQERDMLESMTASMDAGLVLIGKDYRVLWANQVLKQATGNNLENKYCYSIYDQSNQICQDCGVRKVFEDGIAVDRHDYHIKIPGPVEWIELIATPVRDKDGKVVAALELAVNMTERKRLQDKLAEYSQRLEELVQQRTEQLKQAQAELVKSERLAAIGELAGMVGHDLRNPLSGIKNSAYFLKKKGTAIAPSQAKEMVEIIEKCVDYSNKIVNDLLDYSRDIHLELEECSPRQLMLESLAMIQVPENVQIVNKLTQKHVLKADSDKIKRVFVNLANNAIDAMPNGGKLSIEGKVKGNFEISFEDTGTGISNEMLPKLFSPLFTTKAKGMGFGLAICKRIVEAHGGTIAVKTVKDHGTTFTVTLPIEPKSGIGGEKIWVNAPESSLSTMTKP